MFYLYKGEVYSKEAIGDKLHEAQPLFTRKELEAAATFGGVLALRKSEDFIKEIDEFIKTLK